MNIPVLDLSELDSNQEKFIADLKGAFTTFGTCYLINHGIDLDLYKELQRLSKEFFALSLEQKEQISMLKSPQFRGYSKEGGEYTDGGMDYREQLDAGSDKEALNWDINSPIWMRIQGPNLFPKEIPELKTVFNEWFEQTSTATLRLLKGFAIALELPQDSFDKLYGENSYAHAKLLRYPPAFDGNTQGVGSHKDGGLITFVLQDKESGLQGLLNGEWIDVPPMEGSVVVNIGEFLELATNGYLKATIHRVNLTPNERFSIAYFLGVQLDKDIPILELPEHLKRESTGVDTDPKNPLLRNVAENYFKRMIRSHPDVAKKYHSDLIERFSF
ncbi:isopenicillin N synthase family dioxygenase [Campylobacter devanensis]|uniref:isopenicillin N synthase family dioxygenase n=1 Tax=Campylobacter devanensis TaxID=3161138 RepID=UPI000A3418DB|nr:2-oxoglutarate and iron-dependent oxygenase domain-containing protein [Campylobacter sp. P0139]